MKRLRKFLTLMLALCMVLAMSVTVMAADGDGVTSTFTFTNQGEEEQGPDIVTPGETGNTGTTAVKTGDVNVSVYVVTLLIAAACVVLILWRRRVGKGGCRSMKTRTMKFILPFVLSLTLAMGLMTSTVFATDIEGPDPGIQVFAATDEDQTLKVEQKEQGTIGDDVSFTYHLYQILEAAKTIENMGDIIESEPGAYLDYVICDTDTGEEIASGTTDSEGTFALHVGETAEFILEAGTNWYVNQETPEAYPLISVDSDGEYADVVDGTNGVVYYGQIEPEPMAPEISGLTVTSDLTDNEKTYDGETVTLAADVSYSPDTADVSYQWYKDGEEISGATDSTLTIDGNVSDSGTYKCVVTAANDGLTASAEAEATVTIEKAQQDISYAETAVDKYDYDAPFINELTETLVYGDITYSFTTQMGEEPVIELDESTGEVSIKAPGVVVVTATVPGGDNYEEATASYILVINSDLIGVEIDVNNDAVDYDADTREYVDKLVYDGQDLELEMILDFNDDEQAHLAQDNITYQWYSYDFELSTFRLINDATEDTYTLTGEDINAGDYVYLCVAAVVYDNGYAHTVYSVIEIEIAKAKQSIVFEEDSLTAVVGDTVTNEIITEDSVIAGAITYTSSNESIATVDEETGEVTIVGVGTVTITATATETDNYNETSSSYTITTSDEVSVTVTSDMEEEDNTKTYNGEKVTLTAEASYKAENGTYTYQWYTVDESGTETEIEDATEATLVLDGNVADSGTYKCTVTATYPNVADPVTADSDTIEITINKAPQDISYADTEIKKTDLDDPFTNELTKTMVSEEEGAGITYESSDETIAAVDENGKVTILATGEATITATALETANYAEATASYTIVVTEFYNVKYAVTIYGINQDVDENGNTLGLTFGPATGETKYYNTYEAHLTEEQYDAGEGICLHWMSWEEIIEQSEKNPEVFEDCLKNGCTHSVNLTLNETLLKNSYAGKLDSGDGATELLDSIKDNYRIWNSYHSNIGGWPASQIRAVLNGKDDQLGSNAEYALDASDCLFSCFPSVLQDAIGAKAVKSDTVYDSQTEANNKTTYDKLWLFSGKELYGKGGSYYNEVIRTYEGELYQRSEILGITTDSALKCYTESGYIRGWYLRSQGGIGDTEGSGVTAVCSVNQKGFWRNDYPDDTNYALAFGFCLK